MKKKLLLAGILIVILTIILWINGVIPKQIAKKSAISYVNKVHKELDLTYLKLDYSKAHGSYFAVFKDVTDKIYNFEMSGGRYFPLTVFKDPINLPQ